MADDFADYVTVRSAALCRFAYLLTGDSHLAEDLVQEALLRAHRRWASITHDAGPEPYLRKVILRQFLSWRRRRVSTEIVLAEPPEPAPPDVLAERVVQSDEMWTALAGLTRAQRAVLVLRYYEDIPDPEIARLLGCSQSTVRAHSFQALKRLRAVFTPAGLSGGRS